MKNKIPKKAKIVFKGILHDTYQWKQKTFDGTFATFECLKRRPSVTIIGITKDRKIIINHEKQPRSENFITLPGGIADTDDMLSEAKRELLEETGYTSEKWTFYKKIDILNYSKLVWESHFYIAKDCELTSKPKNDSGEKVKVKLYDFSEFIKITQNKKFRIDFIKKLIGNVARNSTELKKLKSQLGI